jgi:hypothetical protein
MFRNVTAGEAVFSNLEIRESEIASQRLAMMIKKGEEDE